MDSLFQKFKTLKVLVIGDVMVDAYVFGKVERICPEAPVPVVDAYKKESRLGGAANVALNLKAMGCEPFICSVVGKDDEGEDLKELFEKAGINSDGLLTSAHRRTTIKKRIISGNHLLLRIDTEDKFDLKEQEENALIDYMHTIIPEMDVVILQDYNKGVLTGKNIPKIIEICNKHNVPTAVDPKKINFLAYKNVSLFKPNLKELKEGLNLDNNLLDNESIAKADSILKEHLNNTLSLITLSERGVYISDKDNYAILPAHIRNISDVSGAGDSVISIAALGLALGLDKETIASLANLAGGLVCEENGVVPINAEKLLAEAKKA